MPYQNPKNASASQLQKDRFQAGLRDRTGVLGAFPKLQQNSCKYYRSIDLFRNKILSVALLGGPANRGKGRRNYGNISTNEIAV